MPYFYSACESDEDTCLYWKAAAAAAEWGAPSITSMEAAEEGLIQEKKGEIMEANVLLQQAESYWGQIIQIQNPILDAEEDDFIAATVNSPLHASISCNQRSSQDIHFNFQGLPIPSLFLYNYLCHSPASLKPVCRLQFLSVLYLKDDLIEYLPDEVGNLVNLRFLGLHTSRLKELPHTLGDLQKLHTLEILSCWGSLRLPEQVLKIQSLRYFCMQGLQ